MKPEQGLVYIWDPVFTLFTPIPSGGGEARPPSSPLLSHYLSVHGVFLLWRTCAVCVCLGLCDTHIQTEICPTFNPWFLGGDLNWDACVFDLFVF